MRVVLDTNVFVSAFLWHGPSKDIFVLAERGAIILCATQEMLEEFERVLAYQKFRERLRALGKTPGDIITEFLEVVAWYPSFAFPEPVVAADPSDDMFLACALAAKASCIISGDRHLLRLKTFSGIAIVSPRQFLTTIKRSRNIN